MRNMRTRVGIFITAGAMAALPAIAQTSDDERRRPEPAFDQAKEALNLADAQIATLREKNREFMQAAREIMRQSREKRQALREETQKDNPDPTLIGQLTVELRESREQIQAKRAEFRTEALAVLDENQRASLTQLEAALKLVPAARQAAALNLLAAPEGGPGFGFGGRGPGGFGGGHFGGRGPRGR